MAVFQDGTVEKRRQVPLCFRFVYKSDPTHIFELDLNKNCIKFSYHTYHPTINNNHVKISSKIKFGYAKEGLFYRYILLVT